MNGTGKHFVAIAAVLVIAAAAGVLLAVLASGGLRTDSDQSNPQATDGPKLGAKIDIPPQFVTSSKQVSHIFTVENSFDEDVTFTDVTTSCQCTDYTLDDHTVPAGGRTKLKIDVRGSPVNIARKSLTTLLTDSIGRKWPYRLSTTFYPVLRLEVSSSFLYAGEFEPGSDWDTSFMAYVYQSDEELSHELTVEATRNVHVDVKKMQASILPSGVTELAYRVTVRAGGAHGSGACVAKLDFHADNGVLEDDRALEVRWRVASPFELDPPSVRFGYTPDSPLVRRTVVVRRRDGLSFRILQARLDLDAVSVRIDPGNHASTEITITACLDQQKLSQSFHRRLELETDDPAYPELGLWVSGIRSSSPAHTLSTHERKSDNGVSTLEFQGQ